MLVVLRLMLVTARDPPPLTAELLEDDEDDDEEELLEEDEEDESPPSEWCIGPRNRRDPSLATTGNSPTRAIATATISARVAFTILSRVGLGLM